MNHAEALASRTTHYEGETIERLYYQISEVAEMIGATQPSQIRFWEQVFGIEPNKRTSSGKRKYTVDEIARLNLIAQAVKDLHLETVKRLLKEGGEERLQEVVDSLKRKDDDGAITV